MLRINAPQLLSRHGDFFMQKIQCADSPYVESGLLSRQITHFHSEPFEKFYFFHLKELFEASFKS